MEYATHLFDAGVSLRNIPKWMGHSNLQTTLQYLHITETAEADARSTIERMFRMEPESSKGKSVIRGDLGKVRQNDGGRIMEPLIILPHYSAKVARETIGAADLMSSAALLL